MQSYIIINVVVVEGNEAGVGGILIDFNQSKVFDRVHDRHIAAVVQATVFGQIFTGCIAASYSGISTVVWMNGHLSEPFSILCSVGQRCPPSFLLYIRRKLEALRDVPTPEI